MKIKPKDITAEKNKLSFSSYIETYEKEIQSSINFIGQDIEFFIELKASMIKDIAEKHFKNPGEINVLDIGSGIGLTDHHLTKYFKHLHGVDVEEEVVSKAKQYNPSVIYGHYDGSHLPQNDESMDLVFAINVMHHIQPSGWKNFVSEMHRVTSPGGIAIVFEHNPLNPLTRLAVSRCEFDRDAVLLRKGQLRKLFLDTEFKHTYDSYIVFFPFRGKIFRSIEKVISWLPLGAQFFVVGKK